jgi:Ca2+-binding EF-hand superfamily protein
VVQNFDQFDINHDSELDESELAAMFKSLAVTLSPLEIRHLVAFWYA